MQIPIGSSLTAPNLTNTGTLCGGGRVNGTLTNEGIACAGQSPGILTIAGNFIQSASGSIQTEIAGTTVGIEYDQISITGPATLAGNLDLVLLGNYAPTPYTPFTILTATSITGIFDTITGADAGNGFSFATIYHPNRVEVMAVLPGDLNLDQQVSIADFIQLASNFNATDATWSDGDINGDGSVSIADFIGLASNFNSVYVPPIGPAAALSASSAAVPEPAMTALLLSLAPFLRRRRFSLFK